jgi:hypothetical protein
MDQRGVILAWKSSLFHELNWHTSVYVVTADLKSRIDHSVHIILGVYGSSASTNRNLFFSELAQVRPTMDVPWLLCGDFN